MKKLLIIPLIVLISLLLTACTANKTGQKGTSGESKNSNTVAVEPNEEEEISDASILDLAKLGKNVKCTYNSNEEETSMEGVVYVAGNKTRSDMKIKSEEGTEMDSSSITDSEWMYMWSSETDQGTKMNLKEMEALASKYENDNGSGEESDNQYKDQTQKVDYKCRPWIVDNSKFDIPTNINFIDMNEMMKGLLEMSERINVQTQD